jgi:hypothetical protein
MMQMTANQISYQKMMMEDDRQRDIEAVKASNQQAEIAVKSRDVDEKIRHNKESEIDADKDRTQRYVTESVKAAGKLGGDALKAFF